MVGVDLGAVELFHAKASQAFDGGGALEVGVVTADVVYDVLHGVLREVARDSWFQGLRLARGLLEGDGATAAVGHYLHAACETCMSIRVIAFGL